MSSNKEIVGKFWRKKNTRYAPPITGKAQAIPAPDLDNASLCAVQYLSDNYGIAQREITPESYALINFGPLKIFRGNFLEELVNCDRSYKTRTGVESGKIPGPCPDRSTVRLAGKDNLNRCQCYRYDTCKICKLRRVNKWLEQQRKDTRGRGRGRFILKTTPDVIATPLPAIPKPRKPWLLDD